MTSILLHMHSITEDNEAGRATDWLPGRLSEKGRALARELAEGRRRAGAVAVFTSDLQRAVETAALTFADTSTPVLHDWRLRECDFGELNGAPTTLVHGSRLDFLDRPYPGGESWREAIERVRLFLADLRLRWESDRVMVISHSAALYASHHLLAGVPLEQLLTEGIPWQDDWRGWEFTFDSRTALL